MSPQPTRRQLLGLSAAIAAGFALAACNRGGSDTAGKKVLLSVSTQTNPFFVQLVDGAKKKAKELGVTLDVQDASDDAAAQANHLQNAITQNVACVIVNPTDSDAVSASVEVLNKAKIPVIAVDRNATKGELASFIASDNVAGGEQAADTLAEAIGDKGKVLVLQGTPGASATRDRGKGFDEAIAKHSGIEVVASQTANFDRAQGLDVATNLLQANPDVVGIFAHNDEMALGAIEALGAKAGKEVKVVGFDGTADGLKAVESGKMLATIAQQPAELGSKAVEQAKKILDGGKAEKEIQVPVVVVTEKNAGEFK